MMVIFRLCSVIGSLGLWVFGSVQDVLYVVSLSHTVTLVLFFGLRSMGMANSHCWHI